MIPSQVEENQMLHENQLDYRLPGIMDNSFNNFSSIRPTPTATSEINAMREF